MEFIFVGVDMFLARFRLIIVAQAAEGTSLIAIKKNSTHFH